jgi:hypothetical protein
MPLPSPVAWVGDLGEVAKQITALFGGQRSGRIQPMGNSSKRR